MYVENSPNIINRPTETTLQSVHCCALWFIVLIKFLSKADTSELANDCKSDIICNILSVCGSKIEPLQEVWMMILEADFLTERY